MRVWLLMGLSAVVLLLAADPCLAGGGGGGERSMFERALDLGIWTLVVFFLLLFILGKFAWPQMLEGLAKRERDIASAVEDARKAREEAALARQYLQEEKTRAAEQVRQMLEEARRDAEEARARRKAEFDEEMAAERERFRREITVAKEQALKELWSQSAQLASLISSKALRRQMSPEDHRGLVDEALADMNRAVEERKRALASGATT